MRASTAILLILAIVAAAVLAVANRAPVTFSFDPFSDVPALAFSLPLFLLVFIVFLAGVIMGGATVALRGLRRRPALRPKGPETVPLEVPPPGSDSPAT
jgi:uncharacterized integral membrane protein